MKMRSNKFLLFLCLLLIPLFLVSCQKTEEKPLPIAKKPEKPLPPVTQERLSLWFEVAGDIGKYIRKVSLKEEEVYEKRTLVMIVHSSARTELEYSKIFEERGMTPNEFWHIIDEMDRVRKYIDIKKEEIQQAKELDTLINSGADEVKLLREKMENEKSAEKKKVIEETIKAMKEKMDEFRSLKSNISPEEVNVDPLLIKLWQVNREKYKTVLAAMWKRKPGTPVRKSYEHM